MKPIQLLSLVSAAFISLTQVRAEKLGKGPPSAPGALQDISEEVFAEAMDVSDAGTTPPKGLKKAAPPKPKAPVITTADVPTAPPVFPAINVAPPAAPIIAEAPKMVVPTAVPIEPPPLPPPPPPPIVPPVVSQPIEAPLALSMPPEPKIAAPAEPVVATPVEAPKPEEPQKVTESRVQDGSSAFPVSPKERMTPRTTAMLPLAGVADVAVILSDNQFYPSRIRLKSGFETRLLFTTVNHKPAALVIERLDVQRWVAKQERPTFGTELERAQYELNRELASSRVTEVILDPRVGVYSFHDALTGAAGEIVVE